MKVFFAINQLIFDVKTGQFTRDSDLSNSMPLSNGCRFQGGMVEGGFHDGNLADFVAVNRFFTDSYHAIDEFNPEISGTLEAKLK